ncbi:rCG41370 [Rattus norvegicus]|uniref:RCG41370 n=1 Tax=Rattus norvegicus TaxID=10116 RepID=A6IH30_RAT|nr:rCG41370 [Rattus norvegicus]
MQYSIKTISSCCFESGLHKINCQVCIIK